MGAIDDKRTDSCPLSKTLLHEILRRMLRIRIFELEANSIRLELIPGALHSAIGQEGAIVGACAALREDDYMTGNHRSHGHPIAKGAQLAPLMAELFGKETGVCRGKGGSMHLAAFNVGSLGESGIVGGSMPAATGAALSARLRGTDQVCLSFFGDGAANSGPFHESMNLASIWRLPVIFFCENNGYATCTAQARAMTVPDVAVRAVSYGMPGMVVNGQDVLAVYDAASEAVSRARDGGGPTLLEAKTYRYCDHVENLKYPPYRSDAEVQRWQDKDPIDVLSDSLLRTGKLTAEELSTMRSEVQTEVTAAVDFARRSPAPDPRELLNDVFM